MKKIMQTLDIYSLGILLLRLSYKYYDDENSGAVRDFIFNNQMLDPDLRNHTKPISEIVAAYNSFVDTLETKSQ